MTSWYDTIQSDLEKINEIRIDKNYINRQEKFHIKWNFIIT